MAKEKKKTNAGEKTKKKKKGKKPGGLTLTGVTLKVLEPSETPFATIDEATGVLALGLPRGEKGAKGDKG